jgi:hypothetical protein
MSWFGWRSRSSHVDESSGPFSRTRLKGFPVSVLSGIDPLVFVVGVVIVPVCRLVGLLIALRGTDPGDRPAIIRALAELFRATRSRRR